MDMFFVRLLMAVGIMVNKRNMTVSCRTTPCELARIGSTMGWVY